MAQGSIDRFIDPSRESSGMAPSVVPQSDPDAGGIDARGRLSHVPEAPVASRFDRKRWIVTAMVGALLVHGGFATLFVLLLDWREVPPAPEDVIPVEIVRSLPRPEPAPAPPPTPPGPKPAEAPAPAAAPPPAFAAPPPEPMRAETQPKAEQPVNPDSPTPSPGQAEPRPAPPAEAPAVLAARDGTFTVTPPAPASSVPTRLSRDAIAAAALARALPMDVSGLPASFRAVLSGGGTQPNLDYRGTVYGRIQRSHRAMETARQRHLEGQVAVIFSVDEEGRAADLKVARSSGIPALDALGLDIVREAEPFPPPPATGKQIFTPTFVFGGE